MTELLVLIQDPTTELRISETPILWCFFNLIFEVSFYDVAPMPPFWLLLKILFVYILSVKWRIAWSSQQVISWEAILLIRALGEKKTNYLELSNSRSKIQKQVEWLKQMKVMAELQTKVMAVTDHYDRHKWGMFELI